MKDVLTRIVDRIAQRFGVDYAEIRSQKLFKTAVTIDDGRVEAATQGIENGTAIRALVKGAWGFASVGTLDDKVLTEAFTDACKMAEAASKRRKTKITIVQSKGLEDKVVMQPKKDPSKMPIEDKIELALGTNNVILGHDLRVRSCTINYFDATGTDYFVNNEGTYIEQDRLHVALAASVTAKEKDVFTFSREVVGSTSGYEMFDSETPEQIGETVARRAVEQLDAKHTKGGTFPVVLGSDVVGTFVHEAFGHLAEADLTLAGSVLSGKLGKRVASNAVTFYDDGTIPDAFGSFKYDDEGIPSQKTLLVKDGIVVGLMHNRETAHQFNARPTGNARAEDFRVEPIIRMRNTFIEPRDYSFEELVEDIKFGYYLKSCRGGEANLDGTFQVGVQEAYEIVNGELGERVGDVSISGNTLETLLKVDAVGKEFELSPCVCGKGQSAFVSDGGAPTRVKGVLVGGSA